MIRSPEIHVSFSGFSRLVYADVADQVRSPEEAGYRYAKLRLRPAAMVAVACFGWEAPTRTTLPVKHQHACLSNKKTRKKHGINKWNKFD